MKIIFIPVVIGLAGCASPWKDTTTELDMTVPREVSGRLDQHVPPIPKAPLRTIAFRESLDAFGNFGKLVHYDYVAKYSSSSKGILEEVISADLQAPPNPVTGTERITANSLCGLVDVKREGRASTTQQVGSSVAVGGAFVPITTKIASESHQKSRLDDFTTTATNLCSPAPKMAFSYQAKRELNRKLKFALTDSHAARTSQTSANCAVDEKLFPAQELHASIRGNYLKVTCDFLEDGEKGSSRYAYLIDSGMYLKLTLETSKNKHTYQYSDAVYADSP